MIYIMRGERGVTLTLLVIATIIAALQKCFSTGIVNSYLYESLENKNKFNKIP